MDHFRSQGLKIYLFFFKSLCRFHICINYSFQLKQIEFLVVISIQIIIVILVKRSPFLTNMLLHTCHQTNCKRINTICQVIFCKHFWNFVFFFAYVLAWPLCRIFDSHGIYKTQKKRKHQDPAIMTLEYQAIRFVFSLPMSNCNILCSNLLKVGTRYNLFRFFSHIICTLLCFFSFHFKE